jgi:hypothetical protein
MPAQTGLCDVCGVFDDCLLVCLGAALIMACGECLGRHSELRPPDTGGALDADWSPVEEAS